MSDKPRCSIDGCERPYRTRGMCAFHYGRWLKANPDTRRRPHHEDLIDAVRRAATDDCILWPYSMAGNGYGLVSFGGRMRAAHVVVCELAHGARPDGLEAAHGCGVKACINPRHLRWATRLENIDDTRVHGTYRGSLTQAQVRQIRRRAKGGESQYDIAKAMGVTQPTISNIVSGRSWAWLADD